MSVPADWTPHRRSDDREPIGWIRPDGDWWVAVDLLGREASAPVEWLDAEEALEAVGLRWLAEIWTLETDAGPRRVRIAEVTPEQVVVHTDNLNAIDVPTTRFELPWPAPDALRPWRSGDPDGTEVFG